VQSRRYSSHAERNLHTCHDHRRTPERAIVSNPTDFASWLPAGPSRLWGLAPPQKRLTDFRRCPFPVARAHIFVSISEVKSQVYSCCPCSPFYRKAFGQNSKAASSENRRLRARSKTLEHQSGCFCTAFPHCQPQRGTHRRGRNAAARGKGEDGGASIVVSVLRYPKQRRRRLGGLQAPQQQRWWGEARPRRSNRGRRCGRGRRADAGDESRAVWKPLPLLSYLQRLVSCRCVPRSCLWVQSCVVDQPARTSLGAALRLYVAGCVACFSPQPARRRCASINYSSQLLKLTPVAVGCQATAAPRMGWRDG